jgi:hypothetical protein
MKSNRLLLLVGTARCAVRVGTQRLIAIRGHRSAASLPKPARREILVLTPEEKRTVCFVLLAFVLGLATKYYRGNHPVPATTPATIARDHATPKPSPNLTPRNTNPGLSKL